MSRLSLLVLLSALMLAACGSLPGHADRPAARGPSKTSPVLIPPPVPKPTRLPARSARPAQLDEPEPVDQPLPAQPVVAGRPLPPMPTRGAKTRSLSAQYPKAVVGERSELGKVNLPPAVTANQVRAEVTKLAKQSKAKKPRKRPIPGRAAAKKPRPRR